MTMFTTCFWTLLSQKDLSFVYLSPWLSKSLGSEHDLLLGTSFFDYFHPEEKELARRDLSELVKKKTLSCSVTRCQYNTIQTIQRKLQRSIVPVPSPKSSSQQISSSQYSPVSSTMTSPNFTSSVSQEIQQSKNDEYIVMDVGMNVVSQEFVLACFHSDDVKQSNSNCVSSNCGETDFTNEEVDKLTSLMRKHGFSKVQTPPSTPFPEITVNNETPNRIFQILDKKSRNLIFTWPDTNNNHISNVSYNKNDFSKLVKGVMLDSNNITRNNNNESPNCLRLISDKHFLLTSGTYRQIESVIIPYGDIIFACFQILPSTTILGVSSAFSKPKARSAPCSPATINNNNGIVKRPRSPGSLSPLPTPFYDDEIKRYVHNSHSNSTHYPQEIPDFILEKRSSKRHRIDPPSVSANDSLVPIKISYSPPPPPQLLLNPISPRMSPSCHDQQQCCQFPFPSQIIKDQSSTLQPPQQPYYPFVVPSGPQSRQPSPKQQDYPSPKNHPSQFLNQNNNHHMTQSQQSPPSTQSPSSVTVTQYASQQRRSNNGNNGNNNNNNNSNGNSNGNNSNNNVQGAKKCESCHTSTSPEWRRGPTGHKTLCNACGLRYSRTIARENRKREQAQREQEQRQREQREREERARERAAATAMMNRVIEPPFSQYARPSNAIMPPGQQQRHHHHHHHHQTSSVHPSHTSVPPQQYHPSTLPPLNYHRHQPSLPHHNHHHHNVHNVHHNVHHNAHHSAHPIPPPLNDRVGYTLPPPNFFDRQQNGAVGASNSYQIGPAIGIATDNHRRDQPQHNGEGERYTTNMMNNMPPTANAYPKEAYFGRAQ